MTESRIIDTLAAMHRLSCVPIVSGESHSDRIKVKIGDVTIESDSFDGAIAAYAIENGWNDLWIVTVLDEAQELPFMGIFAGKDLREMSKLELMKAVVALSRQHTKTLKTRMDDLEFFVA